jgi:hypothetical protein
MKKIFALTAAVLLATVVLVGCGSNSSNSISSGAQPANVFVTGEDAPLFSVVSFQLTINSITLNGQNNSPQVISSPTTVDFARLLGLRSPFGVQLRSGRHIQQRHVRVSEPGHLVR